MILLTVAIGYVTIRGIESISGVANDTFEYPLMSGTFARSAQSNFIRMDRADTIALLTATEEAIGTQMEEVAELDSLIREDIEVVAERMRNAEAGPLIAEIRGTLDDLGALRTEQSELLLGGAADVEMLREQRMDLLADMHENFEYLVDLSVEEGYDFLLSAEDTAAGIYETQLIAIVALILVGLIIAGLLGRSIVRPIGAITAVTTRLSQGDKQIAIPARKRRDEIGAMAGALEVFRDKLLEMDRMNAEREALRDEAEKRVKEGMVSLTHELDGQVQSTVQFVSGKSNEMRDAAEEMNQAISRVSEQADSATQSANSASENVRSVAAAAEQLAHSIGEIAKGVSHSGEVSQRAVREAEDTSATVQNLSDSASKIGDIVSVITDIATQTNLLALNATIEAARAGSAGKGFAVVAGEVKNLANQTTSATEEVDRQIGGIQEEIGNAVAAIVRICETVGTVDETSQAITKAVELQRTATDEISHNAQLTASETQSVSSAIQEMSGEAVTTAELSSSVRATAGEVVDQVAEMQTDLTQKLRRNYG